LDFVDASFLESIGVDKIEAGTNRLKPEKMDEIFAKWENSSD
jgi:hypothetical protein